MNNPSRSFTPSAPTATIYHRDQEYHIGWICSTTSEFLAALEVVDESRDDMQRPGYTLARINGHNVVINKLHDDSRSDFRPGEVAARMKNCFPRIRFVLAVGIGNPTPASRDKIKLGDVVIGTNNASYGDESADTTAPGLEQETSRHFLLAGIEKMKNKTLPTRHIRDCVEDIIRRRGYAASSSRASDRPIRIHYGPVASIESAPHTRQTQMDIGVPNSVLCFDMGSSDVLAAGFDCLSICGIVDCTQSQQGSHQYDYAVLAAAVCAKEYLNGIHPNTVVDIKVTVSKNVENMSNTTAQQFETPLDDDEMAMMEESQNQMEIFWDYFFNDIPKMAGDRVRDVQNALQAFKSYQGRTNKRLMRLSSRLALQERLALTFAKKRELRALKKEVDETRKRLQQLAKFTEEILTASGKMMLDIAEICGNEEIKKIAELIRVTGQYVPVFSKIAEIFQCFKKRTTGQPPESTDSPSESPQSQAEPLPTEPTATPEKKWKPHASFPFVLPLEPPNLATHFQGFGRVRFGVSDLLGGSVQTQNPTQSRRPGPAPVQAGRVRDDIRILERAASSSSSSSGSMPSMFSHRSTVTVRSQQMLSPSPEEHTIRQPFSRVRNNDQVISPQSHDLNNESGVDRTSPGNVTSIRSMFEPRL